VRVVDNETGEDITSVALSQILVDNERAQRARAAHAALRSDQRSGDALYGALKRGVGDAQENLGELQKTCARRSATAKKKRRAGANSARAEWDEMVHGAVERVFRRSISPGAATSRR